MNLINLIDLCKVYSLPHPLSGVVLPSPLDSEACKSAILVRCGTLEPQYYEPEVFTSILSSWFAMRTWNFEHLIKVVQAEYSPIENTDRYTEYTGKRGGKNTVTLSGTDVSSQSGKDTMQLSGSDSVQLSGSDSVQLSGNDTVTTTPGVTETITNTISAENAGAYQPDSQRTEGKTGFDTEQTAYGRKDTTTFGRKDTTTFGRKDTTTFGKKDETTYGKTDTTNYGKIETAQSDGTDSYTEHTHGNIGTQTNTKLIEEELELIQRFNVYEWIAERVEQDFFIQVY